MYQAMCGYEYTSKLQRMFNDIGISKEVNAKYREHAAAAGLAKGANVTAAFVLMCSGLCHDGADQRIVALPTIAPDQSAA